MEFSSAPSTPKKLSKRVCLSSNSNNETNIVIQSPKRQLSKEFVNDIVEAISPSRSPLSSSDRFIPNRSFIDFDYCNNQLIKSINDENENFRSLSEIKNKDKSSAKHDERILSILQSPSKRRIINCFDYHGPSDSSNLDSPLRQDCESIITSPKNKKGYTRSLPSAPKHVLDAPDIIDDYYLNLLDWGKSDKVAIALNKSVYIWNAKDSSVSHLHSLEDLDDDEDYVCSVKWSANNENVLALGTNRNSVQIWDTDKSVMVRELSGHSARVSSLSWNSNTNILSSAGKDSVILNHDLRQRRSIISRYSGHQQEVCGLSWSHDGTTLASGGNENLLCIWDAAMSSRTTPLQESSIHQARYTISDHKAAVKALSWCPWQRNTLGSGGGTADRTIRIWNTSNGSNIRTIDTGSQVCAMLWNERHKEILSSHGFSDNQLILWKYQNQGISKIKEFKGHTSRVLYLSQSPDETTVCSASGDESLRFWDLFGESSPSSPFKSSGNSPKISKIGLSSISLR